MALPQVGLEPTRPKAPDFKSDLSADFNTGAQAIRNVYIQVLLSGLPD